MTITRILPKVSIVLLGFVLPFLQESSCRLIPDLYPHLNKPSTVDQTFPARVNLYRDGEHPMLLLLDNQTREVIDNLCGFSVNCPSPSSQEANMGCCEPCSCQPSCRIAHNCCPGLHLGPAADVVSKTIPKCMMLHDAIPRHGEGNRHEHCHYHADKVYPEKWSLEKDQTKSASEDGEHGLTQPNEDNTNNKEDPELKSTDVPKDKSRHSTRHAAHRRVHRLVLTDKSKGQFANTLDTSNENKPAPISSNPNWEEASQGRHGNDKLPEMEHSRQRLLSIHNPLVRYHSKYLVVDSCPYGHPYQEHVSLCEEANTDLVLDHIPVSRTSTGQIYKNQHCALCNNVTEFKHWHLSTNCPSLYIAAVFPALVDDFVRLTKDCLYHIVPPPGINSDGQICRSQGMKDNVIKQCNVTGEWQKHDAKIQAMCEDEFSIIMYERVIEGNVRLVYKNVFCYMCNSKSSMTTGELCSTKHQKKTSAADFSSNAAFHAGFHASIDVYGNLVQQTNNDEETSQCPSGQVKDKYTNTCRQLICPVYAKALKDKCYKQEDNVKGFTVQGMLRVLPVNPVSGSNHIRLYAQSHGMMIHNRIATKLGIEKAGCLVTYVKGMFSSNIISPSSQFYLLYQITNTIECTVERLINIYQQLEKIEITYSLNSKDDGSSDEQHVYVGLEYRSINESQFNYSFDLVQHPGYGHHSHIALNASFYCPRITLSTAEYNQSVNAGILKPRNKDVFQFLYTMDTDKVEVCYDAYMHQWLRSRQFKHIQTIGSESLQCSIISTSMSSISIIAVIVALCLFKDHQQTSARLFIILCLNLLLAQSATTTGKYLYSVTYCHWIIGGVTQMFWLATVLTLNACLWLMLKKRNMPTEHTQEDPLQVQSLSNISCLIAWIYLMPALLITINTLTASLVNNAGDDCFVHSPKLWLLTFKVPMTLSLCGSFFMFVILYANNGNKNIPEQRHSSTTWYMYLKLTILIGTYWLVCQLYLATGYVVFDYLSSTLNAAQGLYLLWTKVVYKWLIQLYHERYQMSSSFQPIELEQTQTML